MGRWLRNWIREEGLKDVWEGEQLGRRIDPGGKRVSRMDFVLVSDGVRMEGKEVREVGFRDHRLLWVGEGSVEVKQESVGG